MLAGLFIGGLAVLNSAAELGISHVLVTATIMSWLLNKWSTIFAIPLACHHNSVNANGMSGLHVERHQ